MSESPNQTILSEPGQRAITDSFGNAWRITPSCQVSANGVLDADGDPVIMVCYANGLVWRQTRDLQWHYKRHPSDTWVHGAHSPLNGANAREVEEIEVGVAELLAAVKQLRGDMDTRFATLAQTMQSQQNALFSGIGKLFNAADEEAEDRQRVLLQAIATLSELVGATGSPSVLAILQQILALLKSLVSPPPVRIFLDFANSVATPQPVPSRPGP